MSDDVEVESINVFFGSVEGRMIEPGDRFKVTKDRADELKRNALVKDVESAKAEPTAKGKAK